MTSSGGGPLGSPFLRHASTARSSARWVSVNLAARAAGSRGIAESGAGGPSGTPSGRALPVSSPPQPARASNTTRRTAAAGIHETVGKSDSQAPSSPGAGVSGREDVSSPAGPVAAVDGGCASGRSVGSPWAWEERRPWRRFATAAAPAAPAPSRPKIAGLRPRPPPCSFFPPSELSRPSSPLEGLRDFADDFPPPPGSAPRTASISFLAPLCSGWPALRGKRRGDRV